MNNQPEAILYQGDGDVWRERFHLTSATAASVFGIVLDIYVSAFYAPNGPSVIYRSTDDGLNWTLQQLPAEVQNAWIGSLTGTPGNIQASAGGNRILRFDNTNWTAISAGGTTNNDPPGPMTRQPQRRVLHVVLGLRRVDERVVDVPCQRRGFL